MSSKREAMIQSIKEGNSIVLYPSSGGFKMYNMDNIGELPSEADLALGNLEDEKEALQNIEAEIARLEASKKQLAASAKQAAPEKEAAPAKEEAKAEDTKTEAKK